MNERIIELAKKCGYWSGVTIEMNDKGIEDFVQLILKECEVALKPMLRDMISRRQAKDLLKEHFGVE